MTITTYSEALEHVGHDIEMVYYGELEEVNIECLTCNEVLAGYTEENML